jgi:hypothetical protein
MFISDTPKGHPGQYAYSFVIRILSTSLTYTFKFSLSAAALGLLFYVKYSTACMPYYCRRLSVRGITMIFTFPTGRQHISGSYKEMTVQEVVDARLTNKHTHSIPNCFLSIFSGDVKRNR